jgi:hypothetical protein
MIYGNDVVLTCPAVILWDGITRPETKTDGKVQYSLKVAMPNNALEVGEVNAIATKALQGGQFKGTMPNGGSWPILNVGPTDFEGKLPAHVAINAKSFRCPQVFDANNQELPPTAYGQMLYPGAIVQVLVHAFDFNNVSKGIALGLDGVRIIDATAARLPVGGVDASAAFGAMPAAAPPPAAAPGGYQPPPAGQPYAPAPGAYQPPPAAPGVQPAPDFMTPPPAPPAAPAHQMTALAGGNTYEAMVAAGWNDATLRQHGYML